MTVGVVGVVGHDGQVPDPFDSRRVTDTLVRTDRTTLRRKKERGSFDRDVVNAILDEGLVCHVGFSVEGSTFVLPMVFARIEDDLYLHGATGNHMLRALADGVGVCVTVTLLDALVLARSAFHHSMNYRSVMVLGTATRVEDDDEKRQATTALLEHIAPGRSADTRPPSTDELRATLMVRVPIVEGSAKVRTGGPIDEPGDLDAPDLGRADPPVDGGRTGGGRRRCCIPTSRRPPTCSRTRLEARRTAGLRNQAGKTGHVHFRHGSHRSGQASWLPRAMRPSRWSWSW